MKKLVKDFVIIGAGPAGAIFFNKIEENEKLDIVLVDKHKTPFLKLKKMGCFYENFNANTPSEYKFLVDGTKNGKDVADYIKSLINKLKIKKFDVVAIEKVKKYFILSNKNGDKILSKKVILATGLRAKKLPFSFRKNSDISKQKISDYLNKPNVLNREIVFIGSGDSVAFKALKLCKFFNENNIHVNKNIKIFARENFYQRMNPLFAKDLCLFEKKGFLQLKLGNFKIKRVCYNKENYISSLDFGNFVYKSNSKNGAVVCVCIGFEPNLPVMINCDIFDIHIVGDLYSWYSGHIVSLYNAINSINLIDNITTK